MTKGEVAWTLIKLQGLFLGTINTDKFPHELYEKIKEATE